MGELFEYAGFQFEITVDVDQLRMVPVPGQHKAAYKDKHARAALDEYMAETAMREWVGLVIAIQRDAGVPPSRNVDLMKEWRSWDRKRQYRELLSVRTHEIIARLARQAGAERAEFPRRPRT